MKTIVKRRWERRTRSASFGECDLVTPPFGFHIAYLAEHLETASDGQFDWGGTPLTGKFGAGYACALPLDIKGALRFPHSGQKSELECKGKRKPDRTLHIEES
ncbi:MAG: hypothetical protein DRO99_04430 [Candidatus Aenigmatarchaeota archaeon]|nr:MAG: hypothetical protein DRO99_04430 [Candidatus Aenigmarchaeota archaeon]